MKPSMMALNLGFALLYPAYALTGRLAFY